MPQNKYSKFFKLQIIKRLLLKNPSSIYNQEKQDVRMHLLDAGCLKNLKHGC